MKFSNTKSKEKFFKNLFKKVFLIFLILTSLYFAIFKKSEKKDSNKIKPSIDIVANIYKTITYPIKITANTIINIKESFSAVSKNKKYEALLLEKELELQKMKWLENENIELKKMLNFQSIQKHKTISSEIILDASSSFSKSIIINSGSKNGVKKHQAVISRNSLIGFIHDAGENNARVLLATDPASKIPVIIEKTGIRAILAGNNSKFPELKFIEKKSNFNIGDKIISSGFENKIPKGILIGKISKIEEDKILIKLSNDINNIEYIKVITEIYEEKLKKDIKINENENN